MIRLTETIGARLLCDSCFKIFQKITESINYKNRTHFQNITQTKGSNTCKYKDIKAQAYP